MEQLNVALKRVLMNLVGNALEFTPERGRIAIELEEVAGEAQVVVAGAE